MERIAISGPERGQSMEVEVEIYEDMKELFTETVWDASGDFNGANWAFEGRFFFEIWRYEELNGLRH